MYVCDQNLGKLNEIKRQENLGVLKEKRFMRKRKKNTRRVRLNKNNQKRQITATMYRRLKINILKIEDEYCL